MQGNEITKIRVVQPDVIHQALQSLNHHQDATNWCVLSCPPNETIGVLPVLPLQVSHAYQKKGCC